MHSNRDQANDNPSIEQILCNIEHTLEKRRRH